MKALPWTMLAAQPHPRVLRLEQTLLHPNSLPRIPIRVISVMVTACKNTL